ncbi:peripheral plasma membrane protein CASK-like isoform X3 [Symsagittifera roscoffensis]
MSPEVVRCELYGRPVDIWGCGVLLYVLLTGCLPFNGKTVNVYKQVLAPPDFVSDRWCEVSLLAKQLCQNMLTTDQYKRITIDEALQHPWIQDQIPRLPLNRAVKQMCSFNARRKMQSAINVACNSTLWTNFSSHGEKRVVSEVALDTSQAKELTRIVNSSIVTVQDSIEEAHILHDEPKYLTEPSVAHDTKLVSLLKLYDKISVELGGACSKESMSIVTNEKGEVGAFRLCSELASLLDHQVKTSTSYTPEISTQFRDLFQLNYNFNCLLQAHDVIIAELFDSQSNCSSPLGPSADQTQSGTTVQKASPMPTTLSLAKHNAHFGNNPSISTTMSNGNCVGSSGTDSGAPNSPLNSSLPGHKGPEVTRIKQVNFHRNKGEPLGITLKILKTDQVVVSRIMIGGMIHRQKILNEGDEILEINRRSIRKHSEDELRDLLNHISGDIVIKVTPKQSNSGAINNLSESFFVRAMFDYRPEEDATSQAAAAFGLAFQARDILQILKHKTPEPDFSRSVQSLASLNNPNHQFSGNSSDFNKSSISGGGGHAMTPLTENQRWWQARIVCRANESANSVPEDLEVLEKGGSVLSSSGGQSGGRKVGLVPSCLWRMETIRNEQLTSAEKIRSTCGFFSRRKNKRLNVVELSEDEIYERVVQLKECMPRRSLLLVGAPGVGRRSIKNALIQVDHRFAYPKPHTSKPVDSDAVDENGNSLFHHVPHHELVASANRGEYLEVGKYNEAWFGTKYDTIDRIMASNLIPVMDIEPDSIKKLRNSKYMPYVVFVDAPRTFDSSSRDDASIAQSLEQLLHVSNEIDRHYRALFDMQLENRQIAKTVELIRGAFDRVCTNAHEWVPISWVSSSVHPQGSAATSSSYFSSSLSATNAPQATNSTLNSESIALSQQQRTQLKSSNGSVKNNSASNQLS